MQLVSCLENCLTWKKKLVMEIVLSGSVSLPARFNVRAEKNSRLRPSMATAGTENDN